MNILIHSISFLFYFFLLILMLGMIKPWYVLWFMEKKNRLSILKIFGPVILGLFLLRFLLVNLPMD